MNRAGYEFRITLTSTRVKGEYDEPGNDRPVRMDEVDIDRSQLATIKVLEAWLRRWEWIALAENDRGRLLVPETFKVLGEHLWAMALSRVPGEHLKEAITAMKGKGRQGGAGIRVRITFDQDARELAMLPWEFTYLTEPTQEFLATRTDLTLGRYVAGHDDRKITFQNADDKLRILFVYNLPHRDKFKPQRHEINDLLRELSPPLSRNAWESNADVDNLRVDVREVDGWNGQTVRQAMGAFRDGEEGGPVDVVHLIALFRTIENRAEIRMPPPGRDDEWSWDDAAQVVRTLTADRENSPKLVVLHLADWPDSDPLDVPEHFELLAPDLIRADVPAVLAMQYPMRPERSRAFLLELYRRLADGENIGAAVQDTRRTLLGHRDFGSSALYMQSLVDGNLVQRRAAEPVIGTGPASAISPPRVTPGGNEKPTIQRMKSLLLDVFDDLPVENTRYDELWEWVNRETWPDSTDDAASEETKDRLRLRRKAPDVDADADVILRRLLAKVRETQARRARDHATDDAVIPVVG